MDLSFYRGRRVLVTGHTGFKGSWLIRILTGAGADVLGYSRCSRRDPSLFELAGLEQLITHVVGDVRDFEHMNDVFQSFQPQVVFHLAAQPIVRESYEDPRYTYETNVMGTVNVLECVRTCPGVESVVAVTTDKVYRNEEWAWGYRENDPLCGHDPYSNSKSCADLAVHSYRESFLGGLGIPVSSVRAGNVIGGGDFARDRIVPDCVRAAVASMPIRVRNPHSVRPYQHVLEPLFAYLTIAKRQLEDPALAGGYNIGPDYQDCITTGELVSLFCDAWGDGAEWVAEPQAGAPHEANFLMLDCSLVRRTFGWRPLWHVDECMELTCRLYRLWAEGADVADEMDAQIRRYLHA